jgi:hypothetical protein
MQAVGRIPWQSFPCPARRRLVELEDRQHRPVEQSGADALEQLLFLFLHHLSPHVRSLFPPPSNPPSIPPATPNAEPTATPLAVELPPEPPPLGR